jgi:hypothetical protein
MRPRVSESVRVRKTAVIGIFANLVCHPTCLGLGLAQSHSRQLRVGESAERNLATGGPAVSAGQVVADDAKVIERDMRKLRAPGTFPDCPNAGRGGFASQSFPDGTNAPLPTGIKVCVLKTQSASADWCIPGLYPWRKHCTIGSGVKTVTVKPWGRRSFFR